MWIEATKNGKFKAVERYTDPMTGKEKKASVTIDKNTAATRKMATLLLADKIDKKLTGTKGPEKMTFEELVKLYLEDRKNAIKPSSYRTISTACNTSMRIIGADTLIQKLNSGYIRRNILATKSKVGTMKRYLEIIKMILRWGYRNDYVKDVSFLDKIESFSDKTKKDDIEEKYLESDELRKLLDGMHREKWRDLTLFLALTGVRIGEALALTLDDVDLNERTISVTNTVDTHDGTVSPTPKSTDSIRSIYIQDELMPLARKLRKNALAYKIISRSSYLFQDENGPYSYANCLYNIRSNGERILGRNVTPHVLRHTHTSLLAENGVSLEVISRRLGHSDVKITRDIYFHVTRKLKERDNEIIRSVNIL